MREYWEQNPRVHVVSVGQEGHRSAFPPDDLRDLYTMACHGYLFDKEEHYAALRAVLDPVRYTLHSHPTLARVVGRIIGKDEFWVQILGSGGSTSPDGSDRIITGLMARAAELPERGFRAAASELHAFLELGRGNGTTLVPSGLDIGYDVVLFHGLSLSGKIDIAEDMSILPFEVARAFVDESVLDEVAPTIVKYNSWRSAGAVVEGGSDQAHRPGHVPENLIPKKLDRTDGAASLQTLRVSVPSHSVVPVEASLAVGPLDRNLTVHTDHAETEPRFSISAVMLSATLAADVFTDSRAKWA